MKKLFVSLALIGALAGCATNEQGGQLTGAVAGGLLGSTVGGGSGRVVASVIGAGIGAVVGGNIGRRMDADDQRRAYGALETNRVGQSSSWQNPDGTQYTVTPQKTYERAGQPCREYTTTAIIGGKREEVYGTACRQRDGSWKAQ